ncbi:MAG: hypothetical protein CR986_07850 [Ignavibacteriae bacterium]|nr:MAG: hypothetical protein CR986_07850 [Ignavibacteriota bacterium]
MKRIILIIFLISSSVYSQNKPIGKLEGKVLDASNMNPLMGANIFIRSLSKGTSSNENGEYQINELTVGTYKVEISYLGYDKVTKTDVIIRSDRTTYLNIHLNPNSVKIKDVIVESGYFSEVEEKPVSTINFSSEEIRRAPGSAGDVSRILFGLPSLAKVNDSQNSLIVRGGTPIENSFYIDNIEIPNINHYPVEGSSDGPIGILNVDFIEDVNFFTGGFSSIYGNRMSSIMEISYREGSKEKFQSQLNLSMQGAGGAIEGPISEKANYMLSGNIAYLDLIIDEIAMGGAIPRYGDAQLKIVYDINQNNKITLLDIFALDKLNFSYETALKVDFANSYGDINQMSNVIGINWQNIWCKKGFSNTSLSQTYYEYFADFYGIEFKTLEMDSKSIGKDLKLRNVNHYSINKKHSLEFGFESKYNFSNYNLFLNSTKNSLGNLVPKIRVDKNLRTFQFGIFAEHSFRLNDNLKITYGGRLDYSEYNGNLNISPRMSLSYKFNNGYTVTGSAGIFTQDIPENILVQNKSFKELKTPKANHFILGVSKMITESTKLTVESYIKLYENFPLSPLLPKAFILDEAIASRFYKNYEILNDNGQATSKGVEIVLQKKLAENFYGMISGSYSRLEYKDFNGDWHDRIFDNQINFNIDGGYIFNDEWEFKVRWIYAGGVPYTPFNLEKSKELNMAVLDYSRVNSKRLPDYHSLNLRIDKRFYFSNSSLIVYLSMWNAYNRKNIAQYQWDKKNKKVVVQEQWKVIPIFGLEYKF